VILAYEFIYVSKNAVLENFLSAIAVEAKRDFYIKKNNEKITLYVRGDENELESFSRLLSLELPTSIYLRGVSARAIDEWNPNEADRVEPLNAALSFTPKSLRVVNRDGDYRIAPEIGLKTPLEDMPPIDSVLAKLDNGESVAIKGKYTIAPASRCENITNAVVMPTDMAFIAAIAIAKDEDINALASIERPIVKLPSNIIFQSQYRKAPRIINVALAGDPYLYLLSSALSVRGVKAFALENYDRIEVTALKRQNVIVKDAGASAIADRFSAIEGAHYRAFAAAIAERGLQKEPNLGFFLSLTNDDRVIFNSPQEGAIELLKVDFPPSIADIFSAIRSSESGAKALNAYRERYADIFAAIEAVRFENARKNIASLWGIAGLLLGFGGDLKTAFNTLIENLAFNSAARGARIDYKLTENAIDAIAFFRSVISFKLADSPNELIVFGICESLTSFISDLLDLLDAGTSAEAGLKQTRNAERLLEKIKPNVTPKNIFLLGSLFSNKTFSELTIANVSSNRRLLFPDALPLEL
jgi:hypothetical protein